MVIKSSEIRDLFLGYFRDNGHMSVPSSSLVPSDDTSLLFTTAGMVQFKPYFLGQMSPPSKRLTSIQKCFRTTDVDSVGDPTHLTFFEMLGNFSIGDYFKDEAIRLAWEFLTGTNYLAIKPNKLFITTHDSDQDAFDLWSKISNIDINHIRRHGDAENWWGPAGSEGPCGPDSEIFYDYGPKYGCGQATCEPNCGNGSCNRFVELWNLVFMQFHQDREGNRTDLPSPNIDTGMGLERLTAIMQNTHSVYDTDAFQPLIAAVENGCKKKYGVDQDTDYAIRVVSEHLRGATHLISDGIIPGNEGRNYVLRRIIRRAIFYSTRYLSNNVKLPQIAEVVMETTTDHHPELQNNRDHIETVLEEEEENFSRTLNAGKQIISSKLGVLGLSTLIHKELSSSKLAQSDCEKLVQNFASKVLPDNIKAAFIEPINNALKKKIKGSKLDTLNKSQLSKLTKTIPGKCIFLLWDTYGLPPEVTSDIANDCGLQVDIKGFEEQLESNRIASRHFDQKSQSKTNNEDWIRTLSEVDADEFTGYDTLVQDTIITKIIYKNKIQEQASAGQEIKLLIEKTPFYAERGGQVGDKGTISGKNGVVDIYDTQSPSDEFTVHYGKIKSGTISSGESVTASVDSKLRSETANNHTATHLLHAALREILGKHVRQHGSLIDPHHLRFDFSHTKPLSKSEINKIEQMVNEKIRQNIQVSHRLRSFNDAVNEGAIAFFGDKYSEDVYVVEMTDGITFSKEVCGGTHVHRTGNLGMCIITSESSIGSGMRRIEAVTGRSAEDILFQQKDIIETISQKLETTTDHITTKLESRLGELKDLKQLVNQFEKQHSKDYADSLLSKKQTINGISIVSTKVESSSIEEMRGLGDYLQDKIGNGIIVLGNVIDGKPKLIVMIGPELVKKGHNAGMIAKSMSKTLEGNGGGNPKMAQAGGNNPRKLNQALGQISDIINKA